MISYARLIPKVWDLVVGWRRRSPSATSDSCSMLDYLVQRWAKSIPEGLRFDPTWQSPYGTRHTEHIVTLQVLLALQANQLRILVYRQNLMSSEAIEADLSGASIAMEVAKNTIHMISRVSGIYFQRPEPFNYFLFSALAALFLGVLHAPSKFGDMCRSEFYMAVDMVRRSSTQAVTSRRLQKIIRSLKMIQRKRNPVRSDKTPTSDQTSKQPLSAHDMPNNNGRRRSSSSFSRSTQNPGNHSQSAAVHILPSSRDVTAATFTPPGGDNSYDDLTDFFEMAGAYFLQPRSFTSTGAPAVDEVHHGPAVISSHADSVPSNERNNNNSNTGMNLAMDMNMNMNNFGENIYFNGESDPASTIHIEDESLTWLMAGLM